MRPRDNPFAMERLERVLEFRPEWLDHTWDGLLARVAAARGRLTVAGRHGSGKTTFLDALAVRLQSCDQTVVRLFFNDRRRTWPPPGLLPPLPAGAVALLDGGEQLGLLARTHLRRHLAPARLVIAARHRRGLGPLLLHLPGGPAILHRCVETAAPGHYPLLAPHLDGWLAAARGNLRSALRRCYDAMTAEPAT
jgi:hypothetical protein